MKLGCGNPVGPFELLEGIGADGALAMRSRLYREFGQPGLAPASLLTQFATAGGQGGLTNKKSRDFLG